MSNRMKKGGTLQARQSLVTTSVLCALAVGICSPAAQAGAMHASRFTDMGAVTVSATHSIGVALQLQDPTGAEAYVRQTVDKSHPNYHHFLTVEQYRAKFGPSLESVRQTTSYLNAMGFRNVRVDANGMMVHAEGSVARINQTFSTELHEYVNEAGVHFHAPVSRPRLPAELSHANALAVTGLSTKPHLSPKMVHAPSNTPGANVPLTLQPIGTNGGGVPGTATNTPGSFTVGDVAQRYNISPLYRHGVTGRHTTIGIATLANFVPADAYAYWAGIGLKVDLTRITQVHVDGGAGAPSAAGGSGETSLDVEQSGGLAPDAKIIVYDGPNTDSGFLDLFNQAVSDDKVDVLSTSWGESETYYMNSAIDGNVDDTGALQAMHNVFLEAAAQGISVFAAAGDDGAYDANRDFPYPTYTKFLDVDYPASDTLVTAAGGTTVPVTLSFTSPAATVTVSQERPWAWDYLSAYISAAAGPGAVWQDLFSTGGGGGVSSYWPEPIWQYGEQGVQRTAAGQTLAATAAGSPALLTLPTGFAGRNVPDVALNADPETGYAMVSSLDSPSTQGWMTGWGGTSFVAPQLAGITALLTQYSGGRIGLLTPQLYFLHQVYGYGSGSPFNAITTGDNWYYNATKSYNPATGLGTLNVGNLANNLF